MKVNLSTQILKNRYFLKGLEKISEHGTSFLAGTSLVMSLTVRPLAIMTTPDTEKENKQYAASNSICSGLMKFVMVEAVALPLENAVKNIDKTPEKYLKKLSIARLTDNKNVLSESKSYKLLTQIIKLSAGFLTAIPKSIFTVALIPLIMDNLFRKNKRHRENLVSNIKSKPLETPNFTGHFTNKISKGIGKLIDDKRLQDFAIKYQNKDKDIAKHITAGTDILLTSTAVYQTDKSEKIEQNRKKALIYNNIISTAITILGGYGIDRLIKNKTNKFVDNFKTLNASDPKLAKYVEGINILRPALIFAFVYYGILPIFSTFMSEKIDKFVAIHSK